MPGYVSRESADRWNRTAQIVAGGGAGSFTSPVPFADSGAEPLLFKNVSGETIPPFACVQLTGTTESGTHTNLLNADQPADANGHSGPYAFNGASSVAAGEIGTLQSGPAYRAIYNSGTQTAGIKYHPIKDSWEIKGAGFGKGCGIWSYVGTDDIIADTIRVKSCAGGETACDELEDLAPGTYRGIAGATTAPGETGPVIVTGCDGDVTIDAVNHSGCTFYLGDRISVHIDPCCVAHFDGCSAGEPAACDTFVSVCIGGVRQLLAANGGTHTFDVADCCGCSGAELEITLSCDSGAETITAAWDYTCGATTDSGTVTLDSLYDFTTDVSLVDQISVAGCYFADSFSNYVVDCEACDANPCSSCKSYTITNVPPTGTGVQNVVVTPTSLDTGDILTVSFDVVGNALGTFIYVPRIEFSTGLARILSYNSTATIATDPGNDCDGTPQTVLQWTGSSLAFGATASYTATFRMQLPATGLASPRLMKIQVQPVSISGMVDQAVYSFAYVDCP